MSPFFCACYLAVITYATYATYANLKCSAFFTAQTQFINTSTSLLNYRGLNRIFWHNPYHEQVYDPKPTQPTQPLKIISIRRNPRNPQKLS
jgi:hypothetical protein